MTFAFSGPLQSALYQRLTQDVGVTATVGSAIFDALPLGPLPPVYVTLGADEVRDLSDMTSAAALHRFSISVYAEEESFLTAKAAASAICEALLAAPLSLSQGQVVDLRFLRAKATRRKGGGRQVTLWFAAHIDEG